MKRGWPEAGPESRDSPFGTQEDHRRLTAEHRIDSDPPAEVSQVGTTGHTDMLAVVDQLAGHRVVKGAGAPSQPGPALQQGDPQSAIDQPRRGRQARQAPADNHNMRRRRLVGRSHVETVSRSWSGEAFHSSKTVPIMTEHSEDERDRTHSAMGEKLPDCINSIRKLGFRMLGDGRPRARSNHSSGLKGIRGL